MSETTDAAALFAPLWRHKLLILMVGLLVAGATYYHYKHKPHVYAASTQINLASGVEEQGLLNGNQGRALDSHIVGDAVTLITSNAVAEQVRAMLRSEHARAVQGKVRASATTGSDLVTISTEAAGAKAATRLANAYAQVYIKRQRGAYLRVLEVAIANTRRQLRRIEAQTVRAPSGRSAAGARKAPSTSATTVIQAANLSSKLNQLESELNASGVQQVNPAKPKEATLVSPKPKQNAIFGFVLGIAIAALLAVIFSRFDRRMRSVPDIEHALGTHVLAALPSARNPIARVDGQPAVAGALVEPFWRLRAALRLGDALQHGRAAPPCVLCLSPETGDGKSILVAGLALVLREAGERVAVIDADLRRPAQAELLGIAGTCGLAELVAGAVPLADALQPVALGARREVADGAAGTAGVATAVRQPTVGSVAAIATRAPASNPPAVLASKAVPEILRSVAEDVDWVLVDAPSPLEVSDALPLLGAVDGILLVARAGHTSETSAARLAELLARSSSAPVCGAVANDVPEGEMARYGYSATPARRRSMRALTRR